MKAGTLIFLIVLILIAFGFETAKLLDLQQETTEFQAQVDRLTKQLTEKQTQLISCQDQSKLDAETIRDQEAQIVEMEKDLKELERQINDLEIQISILRAQSSFIEFMRSNPFLIVGALVVQFATSYLRYGNSLMLRFSGRENLRNDEFVRLNAEERAWLISKRRKVNS